jgi:diguanylate cyclase (GGDEF)-like protein
MAKLPDRKRVRIGFFFRHLRERYSASIWPTILETAHAEGADTLLFPASVWRCSHNYADTLDAIVSLTGDLSLQMDKDLHAAFLTRFSCRPRVHISVEYPGEPGYLIDNRSGIRDAVRHFALNHQIRDIAFVTGPDWHEEARTRLGSYRASLEELGIAYREEWVYHGNFLKDSGIAALRSFLDERRLPLKAVICSNDGMALALIDEAARRGLEVPRDLLVIGFDDFDSAMIGPVSLTTVRQPFRELASIATRAAIAMARGETPDYAGLLPTRFMVRNSCGCRSESIRAIAVSPEPLPSGDIEEWRIGMEPVLLAAALDSGLPREELAARVRQLLDAYSTSLGDGSAFLRAFGECLDAESRISGDPLLWHAALSAVSNRPGPFPSGEAFLRAACLLVEEAQLQMRLRVASKHNAAHWAAEQVISRLLIGHSREKLGPVLVEELAAVDIPSAVIALYDKPIRSSEARDRMSAERLSLLCAYARYSDGRPQYGRAFGDEYPAADLFPPGFPASGRDFTLEPLCHGENEYGIILQEIYSPRDTLDHEMISQQISADYKRLLVEEARLGAQRQLETALESLREANEKLFSLSRQDELSGLLNRRGFIEDAERNLALAKRMGAECVVFFIDMDGLKDINDTYGHDSGDAAIRGFSAILRDAFRATDIVSRLGGDEFTAFSFMSGASASTMAGRVGEALAEFNSEAGLPWAISASIGAAAFDAGRHKTLEDVLKDADIACYREKARKRAAR